MAWKTIETDKVYDNPWIAISHRRVLTPNQTEAIYGKVHFKNIAIAIVAQNKMGQIILVGQDRYTLGDYSWELPEGGCPLGNSILVAAQRELQEETGYTALYWDRILTMHTSNSVTDELAYVYYASQLTYEGESPEDSEKLRIRRLSVDECISEIEKGLITDALSIAALYAVRDYLSKN